MSLVTMERKCFCLMPIFLCVVVLFYRFISFNREWLDNGGERKVLHEKWNNLLLLDNLGQVVLNKSIQHLWEQPLKKWDHMREILAFIHIVKSGGTSFESTISLTEDDCRLRCVDKHAGQLTSSRDRICPSLLPVLCGHFDWSTIDDLEQVGNQVAPIVLLRDPIKRVVSHFFYAQRRKEMRNNTMTNQTFSEFLQDLESMMQSRQVWFDGQVRKPKVSVEHMQSLQYYLNQPGSVVIHLYCTWILYYTPGHICLPEMPWGNIRNLRTFSELLH